MAGLALGLLSGGLSLYGARQQSKAMKAQGEYQSRILEDNAKISDFQAQEALKRGDREAKDLKKAGQQLIGSQRAALAAQGIDVNRDDAATVQSQTAGQIAEDAVTLKNNAWREAWGYRVEAQNQRQQAKFARQGAQTNARATLLTGGLQAVNSFADGAYKYYVKKGG
jgi:hypothetical protein